MPPEQERGEKSAFVADAFKIIRGQLLGVLVGSLGVVATTIAVLLGPLQQIVVRGIWPEEAEVSLVLSTERPREGESVEIQALLFPTSVTKLSPGWLEFTYDVDRLQLQSGEIRSATSEIGTPVKLPESVVRFVARQPGAAEVRVTLRTRDHPEPYSATTTINVQAADSAGVPSMESASGEWTIHLGTSKGVMQLIHRGAAVAGHYMLGGLQGAVDGTLDGTQFTASFFRGEAPLKWFVIAKWEKSGHYTEIKGDATLYRATGEDWKAEGATKESFVATADTSALPSRKVQ